MALNLLRAGVGLFALALPSVLQAQVASSPRPASADADAHPQDAGIAAVDGQTAPSAPAATGTTGDDDSSGIKDIIVTAQRRAQSIQSVPIAISAFSAAQLEATGATNTLQLAQYVPNLVALNNTAIGSANAYFLRGVGNVESIATFDPPVGTYVDDVYIARQSANNLQLFDVERVEVLRGPQGTLFGRNTTGGAVSVILRKPGHEFGGYAEAGYGSYNRRLARASVDLPLAPNLSAKVSGYYQNDDGYVRDVVTGQRLNGDKEWGARFALAGDFGVGRWSGAFAHTDSNVTNLVNFDCNPANPTQCDGRFASTGLLTGEGSNPKFAAIGVTGDKKNYGLGSRGVNDLVTSTLEFDVATKTTLALITGYVSTRDQYAIDAFDGRSAPTLAIPNPPVKGFATGGFAILNKGKHAQFTQEIKLNGQLFNNLISYVAGFYYFDEYNATDFADVFTLPIARGGVPIVLADRTIRNSTIAYAGYAQADFNLTHSVTLTAGVRYTDETKTFDVYDNRPSCQVAVPAATCLTDLNMIAPSGVPIPRKQIARLWTPRFVVNYKPAENLLFYVSATNGFKSGGWNARAYAASQLLPFGPEKAWSYEAGLKSDLFDRRVRANLTFFWLDVNDLQSPSGLVAPNGTITFLTRNFANYRNRGLEAEFTFAPVTGLNLFANFGYQKDEYRLSANAPAVDVYGIQSVAAQAAACKAQLATGAIPGTPATPACASGIVDVHGNIATPVRTPDLTLALGGSYRAPLGALALIPSVNASYRGRQEVGVSNLSFYTGSITGSNGTFPANPFGGTFITGSNSSPAWIINSSLTLSGPADRWALIAECSNCFDKSFVQSTLANFSYLNEPRRWMLRARYKF